MTYYAVFNPQGALVQYVQSTAGIDPTHTTQALPADFNFTNTRYVGGQFVTDQSDIIAALKNKIALDAEAANSSYVTSQAKPFIYAMKVFEMQRWSALTSDQIAAMSDQDKQYALPFMWFDSKQFGDTMTDAYNRFAQGSFAAMQNLAQTEALVQKAVADMKASNGLASMTTVVTAFPTTVPTLDASAILDDLGQPWLDHNGLPILGG